MRFGRPPLLLLLPLILPRQLDRPSVTLVDLVDLAAVLLVPGGVSAGT